MNEIKIDWYTKTVLTIIAICLLAIVFKPLYITEKAGASPDEMEVDITSINGRSIIGGELPVEVEQPLDVNIDEIGGGYVGHGGPIEVEED